MSTADILTIIAAISGVIVVLGGQVVLINWSH